MLVKGATEEQAHFLNNWGPELGEEAGKRNHEAKLRNQCELFKKLSEKVVHSNAWTINRAVGNSFAENSEILVSALSCQGIFLYFLMAFAVFFKSRLT